MLERRTRYAAESIVSKLIRWNHGKNWKRFRCWDSALWEDCLQTGNLRKGPTKRFLKTHNTQLAKRPDRRHNKTGIIERKHGTVKPILERLQHHKSSASGSELLTPVIFLSNVFSGSNLIVTFRVRSGILSRSAYRTLRDYAPCEFRRISISTVCRCVTMFFKIPSAENYQSTIITTEDTRKLFLYLIKSLQPDRVALRHGDSSKEGFCSENRQHRKNFKRGLRWHKALTNIWIRPGTIRQVCGGIHRSYEYRRDITIHVYRNNL